MKKFRRRRATLEVMSILNKIYDKKDKEDVNDITDKIKKDE